MRRYSLQKNLSVFIHSFNKMVGIVQLVQEKNAKRVSKYDPYTDGVENWLSHAVGRKKIDTTRNVNF